MKPLLVIGGGLIGLTTAKVLLERGEPVRVLEAREGVGLETSFANGGLLTPSMPDPWNAPGVHWHLLASLYHASASMRVRWRVLPSLFSWGITFLRNSTAERFHAATQDNYRLARYSIEKTLALTERCQLQYDLLDAGTLVLFKDQRHMTDRLAISEFLAGIGLTFEKVDPGEIVAREPALRDVANKLIGGIWFPDDASGDAQLFCRELARLIIADGGEIDTGMRVTQLLVRQGKVCGVETDRGRIEADRIVVAAGVCSPALLRRVEHPLPVKPVKGYSLTIDATDIDGLPGVAIMDDESHAVISRFGNRIRVAGIAEFSGFDKSIDKLSMDHLYTVLESLLPGIASRIAYDSANHWAGLRPMSNDGRPFIGPGKIEGLYINAGHGADGWTMAMGSAHLLVDAILGRPAEIDSDAYSATRNL